MKPSRISIALLVVSLLLAPAVFAQSTDAANQSVAASPVATASAAEVPRLIKFSGTLLEEQGQALKGPVGVTFALYSQQTGGAALWLETQNIKPDASGNYTVLLGANTASGVPADLFVSGEARWLGIQVGQRPEHERILLVSVPYALKAGDAETLGGKPLSSFVLNEASATGSAAGSAPVATSSAAGRTPTATGASTKTSATPQAATPCSSITSDGAAIVNSVALFTTACNVESSVITQASGNVGIGTATPAVAVDVMGNNAGLRLNGTGTHQVTVTSTTTGVSGRLGQDANGFFFSADTNGSNVRFLTNNGTLNEWMRITSAGNVGIGTTAPAAKLDVNGNLNLPTTGVISLGGTAFAHTLGPGSALNTFVGLNTGNFITTGRANSAFGASALQNNKGGGSNSAFGAFALQNNTSCCNAAFGDSALQSNTTGDSNSAFGHEALFANTMGVSNSAFGFDALGNNTTACCNAAFGYLALQINSTGGNNTALGYQAGGTLTSANANVTGSNNTYLGANAGPGVPETTQVLGNATAIGANALVNCSNCMVLGNGTVNVGIGTAAPSSLLHVVGSQPASVVGNGTTAAPVLQVTGGKGGNSTSGTGGLVGGIGAAVNITSGAGGDVGGSNSHNGNGGDITIQGGPSGSGGDSNAPVLARGGTINLTGGAGSSNIGMGDTGGSITITGGAGGSGGGMNGNGGSITIQPGLPGSGSGGIPGKTGSVSLAPNGGFVGIGTTGPDNLLTVNGSADKPGGGSWGTFSDGRLKNVYGSFHSGLKQVLQLRPIRYQYKEENALGIHDPEEHIGLVAQEVQRVIPEAVTENNKGYLLVNNDPILWSMLNAIKEQQVQIESQARQIRAQRKQLRAQAAELAKLKARLEKQ